MKLRITIIVILISNAIAAQQVVSIHDEAIGNQSNIYYKDVNLLLPKFEGDWIYQSDSTELKISIRRKVKYHDPSDNTYIDFLIGEYRYSKNGNEIVNTLDKLNDISLGLFNHSLYGNFITQHTKDQHIIVVKVKDWSFPYLNTLGILKLDISFPNSLIIKLIDQNAILPHKDAVRDIRIPLGTYTLRKM